MTDNKRQADWLYIIQNGGHLVRCSKNKRAIDPSWQDAGVGIQQALAHVDAGGLMGVIPGTLGFWVIDQDKGPLNPLTENIDHIVFTLPTRTVGHAHHWVPRKTPASKELIGNKKWKFADCVGDIRCDRGYVVIWNVEELVSFLKIANKASGIDPIDTVLFSKTKQKELKPSLNVFIREQIKAVKNSVAGERNDMLNIAVYRIYAKGMGGLIIDQALEQAGLDSGLEMSEVLATLKSARSAGQSEYINKGPTVDPKDLQQFLKDGIKEFQPQDENQTTGAAVYEGSTWDHMEQALSDLGYTFRFNTLSARVESSIHGGPWFDVSNGRSSIRRNLESSCFIAKKTGLVPFTTTKERFDELMETFAEDPARRKNPLIEWAKQLPEWDGEDRLSNIFTTCLGVTKTPLSVWSSYYMFSSVLIRNATDGAEGLSLDQMLFLIGPQGIGKSKFIREALPEKVRKFWVANRYDLNWDEKTRVEAIVGKVFSEVAEVYFNKFFSIEALKAFLSSTADEVRLPYKRRTELFPRTATLIATLNDNQGLPDDPTGNRRFIPITCHGIRACGPLTGGGYAVHEWWEGNREQLWAQAWEFAQKVIKGESNLAMSDDTKEELYGSYDQSRDADHHLEEEVSKAIPAAMAQEVRDAATAQIVTPPGIKLWNLDVYISEDQRKQHGYGKKVCKILGRMGWESKMCRVQKVNGEDTVLERRWVEKKII